MSGLSEQERLCRKQTYHNSELIILVCISGKYICVQGDNTFESGAWEYRAWKQSAWEYRE